MTQIFYPPRPLATPTAKVGLTAVAGTAQTAMRSDGAPALDQDAAFAFTGLGATTISANGASTIPPLKLTGTIFTGGGTTNTKPALLVEPTGTTSTAWNNAGTLFGGNAPSGFTGHLIDLKTNNSTVFRVNSFGTVVTPIGFYNSSAETTGLDLSAGASSIRFFLNAIQRFAVVAGGQQVRSADWFGWSSTGAADGSGDLFLTRPSSATLQLGAAAADTTGVSQTLQAQGVTTGGTNNQAGGDLTIASGQGKGNVASSLIFQTPAVGASSNTLQTMTTRLAIDGTGLSTFTGTQAINSGTLASGTSALAVTTTLSSGAAIQTAVSFEITGLGSDGNPRVGLAVDLLAGYSGAGSTQAIAVTNASVGVNGGSLGNLRGNQGFIAEALGTTVGTNVGASGYAIGGNQSIGLAGVAVVAKNSATNIGVLGFGRNTGTTPIQIGGYFGIHGTTDPTFASAALMADNGSSTSDIFVARDNGSPVFTIADGGNITSTGTLTTTGGATLHTTSSALTDGAGVALGTLATAPTAGNPTKWIGINDNGTTRYIPAW